MRSIQNFGSGLKWLVQDCTCLMHFVGSGLIRPLPFDQVRGTDNKLLSFPLKDQGRLTRGQGGLARNRVGLAPKFHPVPNRKATDEQMIRKGVNLIHRELIIHYPGAISNCPLA